MCYLFLFFFFFQAEDGIRDVAVTGVQTCALPICLVAPLGGAATTSTTTAERSRGCRGATAGLEISRRMSSERDRKSVVWGKTVDLGGRRIIKKKKRKKMRVCK